MPLPLLLAAGVALMLTVSPLARAVPGRDSGVYLYVASTIMDGGLPYRDVWDHKPPGVHYIDVIGLALGGRSLWGVWAIQTLFICAAICLGYALMRKALGVVPAFFGSAAWMATLGLLLIWDNYPEEYALPLQFGSLYLFCEAMRPRRSQPSWRRAVEFGIIGVLAAGCFLLKPTLVGIPLAGALLQFGGMRSKDTRVSFAFDLGAIAAGIAVLLAPVSAYFWLQGVLDEAFDAVLRYSPLYSAAPPLDRFLSVLSGLGGLPALSGAPAVALIAWARICRHTLRTCRCRSTIGSQHAVGVHRTGTGDRSNQQEVGDVADILSRLALIAFPTEIVLVAISGRNYGYYYTAWLPIIGVLCALFAYSVMGAGNKEVVWARAISLCVLLSVMVVVPVLVVVNRVQTPVSTAVTRAEAIRSIVERTSPSDSVLIWGAEPGVNFAAQRRSPTRFAYQYPLYTRGYVDVALVKEFLRDVEADPPTFIIDASSSDRITPPIAPAARARWVPMLVYDLHHQLEQVFRYISSCYAPADKLGPDGWQVYARIRTGRPCSTPIARPAPSSPAHPLRRTYIQQPCVVLLLTGIVEAGLGHGTWCGCATGREHLTSRVEHLPAYRCSTRIGYRRYTPQMV